MGVHDDNNKVRQGNFIRKVISELLCSVLEVSHSVFISSQ